MPTLSMTEPVDIDLGEFNVGSTDRIRFPIEKDGTAWLGIDEVEFVFISPDGEDAFVKSGVNEAPDAGVWYCDIDTDDIDETGYWRIRLTSTDGSLVKIYPKEIGFLVNSQ